ncbi:MAG: glycosyltransferase, partial [Bacteroidetes bacterium]|nr:glycosyltransferase [Bacteroidota bacterium]
MNELPLVSVVTPSFNQARFLEETMLSVLHQDYPCLEYLVIDGGSKDGSTDIIQKYKHRLDYWVSERDNGQSHAINKGWQRSQGEILAYLNSDDTYQPGAVLKAARALMTNPDWAMVYGDCGIIDENGKLIDMWGAQSFDLKSLLYNCRIGQPTVFVRRSVLDCVEMMDESFFMAMDYDLWTRIGLRYSIGYLPGEHLANYRVHQSAKSSAHALRFTEENERVIRRTLADPHLPFPPKKVENRAIGALYFRHSAMLISHGCQDEARPWFWRALRLYPGVAKMYVRNRQFLWTFVSVLLGTRGVELAV